MSSSCPFCGSICAVSTLAEVQWAAPEVVEHLAEKNPDWQLSDGACPACVQESLLFTLLHHGDEALHEHVQSVWPLDAQAAFGALPTPLRLHADPRYTGLGVTIALIDVGFYPHPDLVQPLNRILAWVNAATDPTDVRCFGPEDQPRWPEWDSRHHRQWHGTMTSVAAAGNGKLSHGLYRGLASASNVVLIQVQEDAVRRSDVTLLRALNWVLTQGSEFDIRVVNISLGGDHVDLLDGNPVDAAVASLFHAGITVTAAAGNDGVRYLRPPATAPHALTIGGLDDRNTLDHADDQLWYSNYGDGIGGTPKPELVAPSIWIAAPLLPGSDLASEALWLFEQRHVEALHQSVEERLAATKLITPYYQHVDGTSFAAPLAASTIACMFEANPRLTPALVRTLLIDSAEPIPNVPRGRQGYGVLSAGSAVATVLQHEHHVAERLPTIPHVTPDGVTFLLHNHRAGKVEIYGSWDAWTQPLRLAEAEPGIWLSERQIVPPGRHAYKFVIDGRHWLVDPANPLKIRDGYGGFNSLLHL